MKRVPRLFARESRWVMYCREASGFHCLGKMTFFNFEEIGMKDMLRYLPELVGQIPVYYVQSGDEKWSVVEPKPNDMRND